MYEWEASDSSWANIYIYLELLISFQVRKVIQAHRMYNHFQPEVIHGLIQWLTIWPVGHIQPAA